jgi:hypothetical protein
MLGDDQFGWSALLDFNETFVEAPNPKLPCVEVTPRKSVESFAAVRTRSLRLAVNVGGLVAGWRESMRQGVMLLFSRYGHFSGTGTAAIRSGI